MAKVIGGDKLITRLQNITRSINKASVVEVGFFAGATYPSTRRPVLRKKYSKRKSKGIEGALPGVSGGVSVPMIAAIQEFGAPRAGIPPRPFFRTMVREKQGEWPQAIADLLRANNYDAKKTLEQTGIAIKGQLQVSINEWTDPPLKPATIARKGFAKPLIDTAHLINSVDYEVK